MVWLVIVPRPFVIKCLSHLLLEKLPQSTTCCFTEPRDLFQISTGLLNKYWKGKKMENGAGGEDAIVLLCFIECWIIPFGSLSPSTVRVSLKPIFFSFWKLRMKSNIKQTQHYTGIGIKFWAAYDLIWSCGWPPAVLFVLVAIWQVAVPFSCFYLSGMLGTVQESCRLPGLAQAGGVLGY